MSRFQRPSDPWPTSGWQGFFSLDDDQLGSLKGLWPTSERIRLALLQPDALMPATSLREPSQVLDPSRAGGSPLAPPSPTLPITPPSSALADEASESAFGGQLRTHEVTLTGNKTETICCLYLVRLSPSPLTSDQAANPADSQPIFLAPSQVAGLPKQTATWATLSLASDPALSKLQHRPGAVGEWWRAEALGTNVASAAPAVDRGVSGDADKQQVKLCEKALKVRAAVAALVASPC